MSLSMNKATASETIPTTARAISLLVAATPTVQDAQTGVLHQLLEFSNRYTAQVLSDALVYAEHAGRSGKVEMEDIALAVQARVGWEFGGRVPKEVRPTALAHLLPSLSFLPRHTFAYIVSSLKPFPLTFYSIG